MSDDLAESWPSLFCSVFEETKASKTISAKRKKMLLKCRKTNFSFCLRNLWFYFCTWYSHNWVTHKNKPSWYTFKSCSFAGVILTIIIKKNEVGCCCLLDMSVCCTSHKCICNMNKYRSQNVNSLIHLRFQKLVKIKLNL